MLQRRPRPHRALRPVNRAQLATPAAGFRDDGGFRSAAVSPVNGNGNGLLLGCEEQPVSLLEGVPNRRSVSAGILRLDAAGIRRIPNRAQQS